LRHRKNGKEKKNLAEFCEMNWLEMLNGNHGGERNGEFNFVNPSGRSVIDYTLTSKGVLQDVTDFKTGSEIVQSLLPLTLIL
jgi:hypothetical protein